MQFLGECQPLLLASDELLGNGRVQYAPGFVGHFEVGTAERFEFEKATALDVSGLEERQFALASELKVAD